LLRRTAQTYILLWDSESPSSFLRLLSEKKSSAEMTPTSIAAATDITGIRLTEDLSDSGMAVGAVDGSAVGAGAAMLYEPAELLGAGGKALEYADGVEFEGLLCGETGRMLTATASDRTNATARNGANNILRFSKYTTLNSVFLTRNKRRKPLFNVIF